jgi:hypothetical protein
MTAPADVTREVTAALDRINGAWRAGRPRDMAPLLADRIVMVPPGFSGRLEGRDSLIRSFEAFVREARVLEFRRGDLHVDGTATTAVAQYPFEMVYEREGSRWRSTGWDVWVFARAAAPGSEWVAVWRTMQAVAEEPA